MWQNGMPAFVAFAAGAAPPGIIVSTPVTVFGRFQKIR